VIDPVEESLSNYLREQDEREAELEHLDTAAIAAAADKLQAQPEFTVEDTAEVEWLGNNRCKVQVWIEIELENSTYIVDNSPLT
jgi:hypothetical protein